MYVVWVTMYEEAVAKLTTQVYTVICRHIIYMSYNFTGFVEQLDSQRVNIKVIHVKALLRIIPLLRGMPILIIFFGKIGRKYCSLFPKVTEKKC